MEEIKKETKTVRIIAKDVYNKEGKLQNFKSYDYVDKDNKGKLIRVSFQRNVDLTKFEGLGKFEVEVKYFKIANNYEYPRVYIGEVDYSTIKKIY